MQLDLFAQQEKGGRDAILVEHVQKLHRIARRPIVKRNGAEVFAHALIHDYIAVHYAGGRSAGRQKHKAA